MKQFNGTEYDTLYPKTIASQIPDVYSKTDTLTADTLSKYGLTFDKLPNDVFQQIKTLIDNVQASADGKARIQTSSYVGTGTYGASNPCSLMFDKKPKALCISGVGASSNEKYVTAVIIPDTPNIVKSTSATDFNFYIEYNNNTISWYGYGDAGYLANKEGYNYYYCAIL